MALTVKKVDRLATKGKYADERGLYLQVHSATNRSWLFRYKLDGKTRWMGLGPIHTYGLEEARAEARKLRQQIHQGLCPLAERHKTLQANKLTRAKDKTFQQCADDYFNFHKEKWNAKWQENFTRTMTKYVYPTLGHLSVGHIDTGLVLECVAPIWQSKTTTADSIRRRIGGDTGMSALCHKRTFSMSLPGLCFTFESRHRIGRCRTSARCQRT